MTTEQPSMTLTYGSSESKDENEEESGGTVTKKGNVSQDMPTRREVVMELL
jgi:hypothetical protein